MKERIILHSDLNNFYASVECIGHPELKNRAVIVGGSVEERQGIVLAKNYFAKKCGIKTGMTIWQAKKLCPDLVYFLPHYEKYVEYSKKVHKIYEKYTDKIESFGIDECWLDVTETTNLFGSGVEIANKIRNEIKNTLGLTVSVGVSFNKIFAKLGSDMKKPDAVTEITKENFKAKIWKLPATDILGVGRKTAPKLEKIGIKTIEDVAKSNKDALKTILGVNGELLWNWANGLDFSVVEPARQTDTKSIGNSMTFWRDISLKEEIVSMFWVLAESVAARLAETELGEASVVHIVVTETDLSWFSRQKTIFPSACAKDFVKTATELFYCHHDKRKMVRGLGISISSFTKKQQIMLDFLEKPHEKQQKVEKTIEYIRNKYGRNIMKIALVMTDDKMKNLDIKTLHNLSHE